MTPNDIPELTPQEKRLQRILKGVVIGLALLILIVLGVMIVKIMGGPEKAPAAPLPAAPSPAREQPPVPPAPSVPFGTRDVMLRLGSELMDATVGDNMLVLRVQAVDGRQELIVLDLGTGAERGRFILRATE